LGIARRKIGQIVRCPTCAGQVIVPQQGLEGSDQSSTGEGVFDRNDFDELMNEPVVQAEGSSYRSRTEVGTRPASSPEGSWGTHPEPPFDVEKLFPSSVIQPNAPANKLQGIYLSPARATVLTIAIVVLLAIAFVAGLLVDRYLLS
jgi:hypothetical protein